MRIHPLQLRFIFGQLNLQNKSVQDRYKTHIGVATSLRLQLALEMRIDIRLKDFNRGRGWSLSYTPCAPCSCFSTWRTRCTIKMRLMKQWVRGVLLISSWVCNIIHIFFALHVFTCDQHTKEKCMHTMFPVRNLPHGNASPETVWVLPQQFHCANQQRVEKNIKQRDQHKTTTMSNRPPICFFYFMELKRVIQLVRTSIPCCLFVPTFSRCWHWNFEACRLQNVLSWRSQPAKWLGDIDASPRHLRLLLKNNFLDNVYFYFFTIDKRAFVTFRANNLKIPIQQCLIFLHLQIESSKLDVDCIKINSVKNVFFPHLFLGWWQVALFNLEPSWFYGRFGVGMCMAGSVRALYKGGIPRKHICRIRVRNGCCRDNFSLDSVFQKVTKGAQSRLQPTPL